MPAQLWLELLTTEIQKSWVMLPKKQDKTNPPSYKSGIEMMGYQDSDTITTPPPDCLCFTYRYVTWEVIPSTFSVHLWEKKWFSVLLKDEIRLSFACFAMLEQLTP